MLCTLQSALAICHIAVIRGRSPNQGRSTVMQFEAALSCDIASLKKTRNENMRLHASNHKLGNGPAQRRIGIHPEFLSHCDISRDVSGPIIPGLSIRCFSCTSK